MEKTDTQTALDAGAALAAHRDVNGTPVAIMPDGYHHCELDHLLDRPTRHSGTATLLDAASFIAYVNEFKGGAELKAGRLSARLYYRIEPKPQFVAVLNDNTGDAPAWGDFRAEYDAPLSKEWLTWTGSDQKHMTQEEFALFIERNLPDVNVPPAADMLEIASTLQAKKGVEFASGTRLANGELQFKFEETIAASAGQKGQFSVPERIEIVIPVFDGSKVGDRLVAKFRYRLNGPKLTMWYELDRPHKVLELAVADLHQQIAEGTGLHAFKGVPSKD
ncbi:DUF2303 family protein [Burkholderia mayonis]|uniref:Phosphopentomutase n=1 Tax=Burkholderia mayonis TaxID=1385591 RepID=A0A1B4G152_9BURK|nr:DUF2303 family protein [Burkholderia mayonis]AOJ09628.1 hypothetical protein WS71_20125 [Burkholderia mayonis]KVE52249.1 hypothetical protein WS71_09950 [Burkholderia mayonis]